MSEEERFSIKVAKKYLLMYEALQRKYQKEDILSRINKNNDNYYTVKGRRLTNEEIIAFEMNNIQNFRIENKFLENKNKDNINKLYNLLLKAKINYQEESIEQYKSLINTIYCLLDKQPPFLDEVYQKCEKLEREYEKEKNKGYSYELAKKTME